MSSPLLIGPVVLLLGVGVIGVILIGLLIAIRAAGRARVQALEQQLVDLEQRSHQLEAVQAALREQTQDVNRLKRELESATAARQKLDTQVTEQNERIAGLATELESCGRSLQETQADLEVQVQRCGTLEREHAAATDRLRAVEHNLAESQRQTQHLEQQAAEANRRAEARDQELATAISRCRQLESDIEQAGERFEQQRGDLTERAAKVEEYESLLGGITGAIARLQQQLAEKRFEPTSLPSASSEEVATLAGKLRERDVLLDQLQHRATDQWNQFAAQQAAVLSQLVERLERSAASRALDATTAAQHTVAGDQVVVAGSRASGWDSFKRPRLDHRWLEAAMKRAGKVTGQVLRQGRQAAKRLRDEVFDQRQPRPFSQSLDEPVVHDLVSEPVQSQPAAGPGEPISTIGGGFWLGVAHVLMVLIAGAGVGLVAAGIAVGAGLGDSLAAVVAPGVGCLAGLITALWLLVSNRASRTLRILSTLLVGGAAGLTTAFGMNQLFGDEITVILGFGAGLFFARLAASACFASVPAPTWFRVPLLLFGGAGLGLLVAGGALIAIPRPEEPAVFLGLGSGLIFAAFLTAAGLRSSKSPHTGWERFKSATARLFLVLFGGFGAAFASTGLTLYVLPRSHNIATLMSSGAGLLVCALLAYLAFARPVTVRST